MRTPSPNPAEAAASNAAQFTTQLRNHWGDTIPPEAYADITTHLRMAYKRGLLDSFELSTNAANQALAADIERILST